MLRRVVSLAAILAGSLCVQSQSASLSGVVTDSSGAAVPRAAVRLVNTTGNAGRTDGYGPGLISMVISILKEFSLTEGHRLEFRTEILNMFKSLVGGSQSRIVQLGLRYEF